MECFGVVQSISHGIEACSYVSCCMVSCPFSSLTDRNMDQVPGITNLPSTGILCMIDAALTSMLLNKYRLSPGREGVRLSSNYLLPSCTISLARSRSQQP